MKKLLIVSIALVVIGTVWFLYYHGIEHFLGIDTQASANYDFVSGVGPMIVTALGYTGLLGALVRHVNCHVASCPRIGRFPVAGGQFKVCRRHSGDITGHRPRELTAGVLRELHLEHLKRQSR